MYIPCEHMYIPYVSDQDFSRRHEIELTGTKPMSLQSGGKWRRDEEEPIGIHPYKVKGYTQKVKGYTQKVKGCIQTTKRK